MSDDGRRQLASSPIEESGGGGLFAFFCSQVRRRRWRAAGGERRAARGERRAARALRSAKQIFSRLQAWCCNTRRRAAAPTSRRRVEMSRSVRLVEIVYARALFETVGSARYELPSVARWMGCEASERERQRRRRRRSPNEKESLATCVRARARSLHTPPQPRLIGRRRQVVFWPPPSSHARARAPFQVADDCKMRVLCRGALFSLVNCVCVFVSIAATAFVGVKRRFAVSFFCRTLSLVSYGWRLHCNLSLTLNALATTAAARIIAPSSGERASARAPERADASSAITRLNVQAVMAAAPPDGGCRRVCRLETPPRNVVTAMAARWRRDLAVGGAGERHNCAAAARPRANRAAASSNSSGQQRLRGGGCATSAMPRESTAAAASSGSMS